MVWNLTSIVENSTDPLALTKGVNDVLMLGWFGTGFIVSLMVICFIAFYRVTADAKISVTSSMFIGFGLSILLRALDLVPDLVLYITLIGLGISLAFTWK